MIRLRSPTVPAQRPARRPALRHHPARARTFGLLSPVGLLALSGLFLSMPALAQTAASFKYPDAPAKIQPFRAQHLPRWLTLDAELRGRTEGQTSFDGAQGQPRVYELTRVFGGLEVRPTTFLTGYLQILDAHAFGLPSHAADTSMRDLFDLRQGFLNLHLRPAGIPLRIVAGRQELRFGSQRVIGVSDWSNNSRSWDGFSVRLGDRNRVDLFSTSVVTINPTSLDTHGSGLSFHGAYASLRTWVPHVHVSPYVLVNTARGVRSSSNLPGNQVETTVGTELEGALAPNLRFQANASLQRGSFAGSSIHAGQSFVTLGYLAGTLPWKPRLGGEFDFATGTAHPGSTRLGTYDQQYPSNHNAFGQVDLFGYQNIRQERLNLDLAPTPNLHLLAQAGILNLAQKADNLYSSSADVMATAPPGGFPSSSLGQELDLSARFVVRDRFLVQAGAGHLFPGAALRGNSLAASSTLGYLSLTYRFRLSQDTATTPDEQPD